MSLREFGLLLLAVLTATAGQFLLKLGALKLGKASFNHLLTQVVGIATTPELLLGLALYGLGAVLYILLLTRVPLSVAGPAASLGYVFSVLLGYYFFREPILSRQLAGLGLIVCGVILLAWKR
jgi:drug/metabolite transporter (DMT)-like permease